MKLRSDGRGCYRPAKWLIVVGLCAATSLPRAAAFDEELLTQSTLGSQVAPQNLNLDAAISSMVNRRLIAGGRAGQPAPVAGRAPAGGRASAPSRGQRNVPAATPSTAWRAVAPKTAAPAPNAPPNALTDQQAETLGWRAARLPAAPPAPAASEILTAPVFPTFPSMPLTTAQPSEEGEPIAESEPIGTPADDVADAPLVLDVSPTDDDAPSDSPLADRAADEGAADEEIALALPTGSGVAGDEEVVVEDAAADAESEDAAESEVGDEEVGADDHLAPIDELSETPAPASDAPGDPLEPEYTGPALAVPAPRESDGKGEATARPLRSGAAMSRPAQAPIGEPDRFAEADESLEPADPETYQEEDAPSQSQKLRPMTRNQRMLRDKIRRVLQHYYNRPLNTADRSPWEVMHAMLAYEVHSRVLQGGPQGEPITAVGWLCFNQPCKNRSLMYLNEDGDLRVKVGPALQGHQGQLLALLAQARVRSDYPLKVDGQDFTIVDLIEMEKSTCYPRTELTFKLIGLQRYLDIEDTWVNDQGMQWDFPTMLREEMRQPVRTAACGGTHRLSGLALTVKKRRASGLPVNGEYAKAVEFVANYRNYAYRLQNPDGSFSTDWFKGPGAEADVDRRLKTSGHILEWMIYSSSEEELTNPRMVRAVNYLTNIMYSNRTRDWEAGPLGHAIHALVLYDRLVFAKYDEADATQPKAPAAPVARRQGRARR